MQYLFYCILPRNGCLSQISKESRKNLNFYRQDFHCPTDRKRPVLQKQRHTEAGPFPAEGTVLLPDPGQHQTKNRTGKNPVGKVS